MEGQDAMSPRTHPHHLTYDDFLLCPDDGLRHELIDGEHFVTPSPNMRHQDLLAACTTPSQITWRQTSWARPSSRTRTTR